MGVGMGEVADVFVARGEMGDVANVATGDLSGGAVVVVVAGSPAPRPRNASRNPSATIAATPPMKMIHNRGETPCSTVWLPSVGMGKAYHASADLSTAIWTPDALSAEPPSGPKMNRVCFE